MKNNEHKLDSDYSQVHSAVATVLRDLYVFAELRNEDAIELKFKHRGGGDWLVIAKRYSEDGKPEVLFSQAYDFVGALIAVSRGLGVGKWKEDRPWNPEK